MSSPSLDHSDELGHLETILEEFRARLSDDNPPTIAEFQRRYPDHSRELPALLTAIAHLEVESDSTANPRQDLERSPHSQSPHSQSPQSNGRLGPYELRRVIARGGMGVVYEAYHAQLDRVVALKVLPYHLDCEKSRERFQREVKSAARLEHPHIVPVYASGEADGLRYYAMQYIEGRSLDRAIADARANERDGLGSDFAPVPLIAQAARALDFAHENGVLHRDIKPSNLIVDHENKVYLADFGLSKSLDWEDLTGTDDVVGTLRYLAPERFSGAGDARSDVYALGLVLYEALTLEPAIRSRDRAAVVKEITGDLPIPPRRWDPTIPRDLETIVLTAIHPTPSARYSSAAALAEDLEAFVDHRPIRARRPGPVRRLALAARRNRRLTVTIAIAFTLLIAGSIAYVVNVNRWIERTRSLALARSASEAIPRDAMLGLLLAREAVEARRDPTTLSTLVRALAAVHEYGCLQGHETEVRWCRNVGNFLVSRSLNSIRVWSRDGSLIRAFESESVIRVARVSATTGAIVYTTDAGLAYHPGHWETDGAQSPSTEISLESYATTMEFEPSGSILFAVWNGSVFRWNPPDPPVEWMVREHPVSALAVSSDGQKIIIETWTNEFLCVDPVGELLWLHPEPLLIYHRMWSPDGEHLLVASGKRALIIGNDGAIRAELLGHRDTIATLAISPDSRQFLTGSADQTARLWSQDGSELQRFAGHGSSIEGVAFHPDGQRILTASSDQTAKLWTLDSQELVHFTGHDDSLIDGGFTTDGKSVITTSADKTVRLWRIQPEDFTIFRGHESGLYTAEFSPDGDRLLTASRDRTVRIWNRNGNEIVALPHPSYVCAATYSPDGASVLVTTVLNTAHHYLPDGQEQEVFESPSNRVLCAWKNEGRRRYLVRTVDAAGLVLSATGGVQFRIPAHSPFVWSAFYDPSNDAILTTSGDGFAYVWDARTGERRATLRGHDGLVRSIAASRLGDRIVTAGDDGTARVWTRTGEPIAVLRGHEGPVLMASFSPDGSRIVTASRDGTARIWTIGGELVLILSGHRGVLWSAQFSPDGRQVVTASFDLTARTWLVDESDLLAAAAARATRELTPSERQEYGDLLRP